MSYICYKNDISIKSTYVQVVHQTFIHKNIVRERSGLTKFTIIWMEKDMVVRTAFFHTKY